MIEGLTIYEEWFPTKDEERLIALLPQTQDSGKLNNRNSIHRYGSNKPYVNDVVSTDIPLFLSELGKCLVSMGLIKEEPDSISVNEYLPGQTIPYHVDSEGSGEIITILSLGSSGEMKFKNPPNEIRINIPPRSLVQLSGEARWKWSHSIDNIKGRRWSIVFRNSTK